MTAKTSAIPWRAILLESGLVVFGLVIALLANGWLDGRRQQERADAAMVAVVGEIRANQASLHKSIQYHGEVLGALAGFESEHGSEPEAVVPWSTFPQGFVLPPSLASHAWDMASATGSIERVPYQRVLKVSSLYGSQERYQAMLAQISQEIYHRLFDQGRDALRRNWRNHREVLGALVYRECFLAWDYEAALPELDPNGEQVAVPEYCDYLPKPDAD